MPLDTRMVGANTNTIEHEVDARWLMAYAASLGDLNPRYMDTEAGTVIGHPVFPVCPEWPVILDTRALAGMATLTAAEAARGVHAAHDLHIYRPIRAGDRLHTQATMIGIRNIKPGAAYTLRLDSKDANTGELIARTYQLGIYRGVAVTGADSTHEPSPELPQLQNLTSAPKHTLSIPANAAHTYTECARIWNPIHTDRKVALQAGLPDIILHGTATLALAVSHIVDEYSGGDATQVCRLGGRFAAMVLMPSEIQIQTTQQDQTISYRVLNTAGQEAISQGFVCLR